MEGRQKLNFSDWNRCYQQSLGEIVEVIREGEMPPAIYLPMHPEAQLTAAEKQQLITGLNNSLKKISLNKHFTQLPRGRFLVTYIIRLQKNNFLQTRC
jgi:hypothetical protein